MLRLRSQIAILHLLLAACGKPDVPWNDTWPNWQDDTLGLALHYPNGWSVTQEETLWIFAGPPGTPAYFTTITLQPVAPLPDALVEKNWSRLYAAILESRDLRDTSWAPHLRPGCIEYNLRFERFEHLHRKNGIFCQFETFGVDLSYAAPDHLYFDGFWQFQEVLDTFTVAPPL